MFAASLIALMALGQVEAPTELTLANGMKWVLVPRPDRGIIGGAVVVRAGGADEVEGHTGVAHMLEHLAFKGTPLIGSKQGWSTEEPLQRAVFEIEDRLAQLEASGQSNAPETQTLLTKLVPAERDWSAAYDSSAFHALLFKHDIRINAHTSKDLTSFEGEFPSGSLGVWLAAEAQRFAAPVFRDFRAERGVVLQELKDGDSETMREMDRFYALAFANTPYAWSTIGHERDVRTISPTSVATFYEAHYAPSNAIGVLVGDFSVVDAKRLLEKTFALIPDRPIAPRPKIVAQQPRRLKIEHAGSQHQLLIALEVPAGWSQDELAMPMFAAIQLQGLAVKSSTRAAGFPRAFIGPDNAGPHLVGLRAPIRKGHTAAEAEAEIFEFFKKLQLDQRSVDEASDFVERSRLQAERRPVPLAIALGERAIFDGNWKVVLSRPRVQAADVEAFRASLTPDRMWIVELVP